ncbi:hypothetical protein MNV49_006382 [Pseudohyphozyma bogoriensis]|nr:hypothetical protein MNV49_006382 [Pseudohyphozyma bogoriensis]
MAPLHGQCYCGEIEYELNDKPDGGIFCHCRTCQILHTDRSYNIASKTELFKLIKGTPTVYADRKADSGNAIHRNFCGACGTALFSIPDGMPGTIFVKVGALDKAADIKPHTEIYVDTQLPELALDKPVYLNLKHFEGFMAKEVSKY